MKIDTRELLERLSTSRREFNATAFAELNATCLTRNARNGTRFTLRFLRAHCCGTQ